MRFAWAMTAVLLLAGTVGCGKSTGKKPAGDACPPVAGQALPVRPASMRANLDSGGPLSGVLTSAEELAASGHQVDLPPVVVRPGEPEPKAPKVDFTKGRLAYMVLMQQPNASVAWVVETPTEIVVGVRVAAYCGGAAPPNGVAATFVPVSPKPVRFAQCNVGSCDPSVLAP